ncbi:SDR family oxidoreductase [Kiloniella sp. b19]|uniref:SDR family oxidoreductase n=1 Tax=Kiloniella sp. GXU_MW_B19 TaxID=3141326 RepID=UPI0031D420F2
MELANKTIIITGASSGIGAAAARLFIREGAQVVLGARRTDRLKELTQDLARQGGKAVFLGGDVTDERYHQSLTALALEEYGKLDGAFNNAGTVGELSPVAQMSTENWRKVIETNLTAAFFAAKSQIPALVVQGGGSIVFTSSFVGQANGGMPGMGAYAASKAGLVGLTQSLAADHGADKIRVNALMPGGTKTEMMSDDPQIESFIANLHALKRTADAEEIAQAALFLLSGRSDFVTGTSLYADGGVSCRLC